MVGRPSKLTPERAQAIALAVSEGHYLQHAAAAAGVARSSVHSWLARGQKARERLGGGGEPQPDEEPYLDLLEALEGAEKCAADTRTGADGTALVVSRRLGPLQPRVGSVGRGRRRCPPYRGLAWRTPGVRPTAWESPRAPEPGSSPRCRS